MTTMLKAKLLKAEVSTTPVKSALLVQAAIQVHLAVVTQRVKQQEVVSYTQMENRWFFEVNLSETMQKVQH